MLAFDRLGRPRSGAANGAAGRLGASHGPRFALGGVAFELLASTPGASLAIEPDAARYCVPAERHPIVADVLCAITVDDAPFVHEGPFGGLELPGGAIEALAHGELELRAPRVRATLCRLAPRRYACSARIASDPAALSALLRSIVAVVVHAAGGVMVHAAGVALGEAAVIFVGPSGAGKSTAATLTEGARMFAQDHVALLPQPDGGVLAYGMPGGSVAAMAQTDQPVWPLAGVLRIMRDAVPGAPRLTALSGAEALFVVREAVECADVSPAAERARLDALAGIVRAVEVGTLHTMLGARHGQLVRAQLARRLARHLAHEEARA